jgi:hypothetical protein
MQLICRLLVIPLATNDVSADHEHSNARALSPQSVMGWSTGIETQKNASNLFDVAFLYRISQEERITLHSLITRAILFCSFYHFINNQK